MRQQRRTAQGRGPPAGPDVYRFAFSASFQAFVMVVLGVLGAYAFIKLSDVPVLAWSMLAFCATLGLSVPIIYRVYTRHQWVRLRPDGIEAPKVGVVPYSHIRRVHKAYRSRYIVILFVDGHGRSGRLRVSTYMDRFNELEDRLRAATPRAAWTRFPLAAPNPPTARQQRLL